MDFIIFRSQLDITHCLRISLSIPFSWQRAIRCIESILCTWNIGLIFCHAWHFQVRHHLQYNRFIILWIKYYPTTWGYHFSQETHCCLFSIGQLIVFIYLFKYISHQYFTTFCIIWPYPVLCFLDKSQRYLINRHSISFEDWKFGMSRGFFAYFTWKSSVAIKDLSKANNLL